MEIFIYMLDLPNNKKYIGQTSNLKKRVESHKSQSKKSNSQLYKDIRKYGWGNIKISVLEGCNENKSNSREVDYIAKYNTHYPEFGYNFRKEK